MPRPYTRSAARTHARRPPPARPIACAHRCRSPYGHHSTRAAAMTSPSARRLPGRAGSDERRSGLVEIDVVFTGVAVTRLDAAAAWYGRLFGRPADIIVNPGEIMWRLSDS